MLLTKLIEPLGIATYVMVLLTVLTGARVIKVKVARHKLLALVTLLLATLHGALVIYLELIR